MVVAAKSFNFTEIYQSQQGIAFIVPLLPVFVIYSIACLAETNRAPFDNVEAESELVAGFFAEHSSVPFVMFFLGEYNALLLVSALSAFFFFGDLSFLACGFDAVYNLFSGLSEPLVGRGLSAAYSTVGGALSLGVKTALVAIVFVWVRATLPRFRFDTLLIFCWLKLLPVAVALLLLEVSLLCLFV